MVNLITGKNADLPNLMTVKMLTGIKSNHHGKPDDWGGGGGEAD